jgi:hypothetical protein
MDDNGENKFILQFILAYSEVEGCLDNAEGWEPHKDLRGALSEQLEKLEKLNFIDVMRKKAGLCKMTGKNLRANKLFLPFPNILEVKPGGRTLVAEIG